MSKIKVFILYHKQSTIFRSDCYEPMQTGCAIATSDLGLLRDDTGDNISKKNRNYAELTGNYWVWKNFLPAHPEVEYVGFCHYRRFLDFTRPPQTNGWPFADKDGYKSFAVGFAQRYKSDHILTYIENYDLILPTPSFSDVPTEQVYCTHHPEREFHLLAEIISRDYPDYREALNEFLSDYQNYICLNYVMRRDLFDSFMTWIFDVLGKLEKSSDWSHYHAYMDEKVAAYLAEIFFNVWLRKIRHDRNIKILERQSILLCADDTVHWYDRIVFYVKLLATASKALFDGSFLTRVKRHVAQFRHAHHL